MVNVLAGQSQPDVNLTVLPSLTIEAFSGISIVCDADVPRFPSVANTSNPQLPVRIDIYIGIYKVKSCPVNGISLTPVNQCVYNLASFYPTIPRRISCTASNAEGGCRFKTADAKLLPQG